MSHHGTVEIKPASDPAYKLPGLLSNLSLPLVGGGLVLVLISLAIGYFAGDSGSHDRFFMSNYLVGYIYCWTVVMGCMFFVMIQHLCRAGWSVVVRRVAELVMMMVVPLGILFLPILLFHHDLYIWNSENFAAEHGIIDAIWNPKSSYLSYGFFAVRAIFYFAVWIGLAWFFFKGSTDQDETGDKAITDRMQYWSGPAIMLFSLTMSFAAFDWVMSLAPMWFSTMFGVYMFAGGILTAHCAITAITYLLQENGAMEDEVTEEHYHDLAKLIFGFTLFWTYISFSQYMLIWYANIPEETEWIYHRHLGTWGGIGVLLIFLHWMLPFAALMPMYVRRRPTLICAVAVYILVMHFLDVVWMIMPEAGLVVDPEIGPRIGIMRIVALLLCVFGMVALLGGLIIKLGEKTKVIAVRDPRLAESIGFENF